MNTLNIFILIMLFLSPFFYLPIVVNKAGEMNNKINWNHQVNNDNGNIFTSC